MSMRLSAMLGIWMCLGARFQLLSPSDFQGSELSSEDLVHPGYRIDGVAKDFREACKAVTKADIAIVSAGRCSLRSQVETAWRQRCSAVLVSDDSLALLPDDILLPMFIMDKKVLETLRDRSEPDGIRVEFSVSNPALEVPVWEFFLSQNYTESQPFIETLSVFNEEKVILIPRVAESESSRILSCVARLSTEAGSTYWFWNYVIRLYSDQCNGVDSLCVSALREGVNAEAVAECMLTEARREEKQKNSLLTINGEDYGGNIREAKAALCLSFSVIPEVCREEYYEKRNLRAITGEHKSSGGVTIVISNGKSSHSRSNKCTSMTCGIGIGISLGVILLIVAALLIFLCIRRCKRKRREKQMTQLVSAGVPVAEFTKGHEVYGSSKCSICTTDFQIGVPVKVTFCDHIFHDRCLDEWINSCKMNPRCPECSRNPFVPIPDRKQLTNYARLEVTAMPKEVNF